MEQYSDSRGKVHSSEWSRNSAEAMYALESKQHQERQESLLKKQVELTSAHIEFEAKLAMLKAEEKAKEAEELKAERNRQREYWERLERNEVMFQSWMKSTTYLEKSSDLDKIIYLLSTLAMLVRYNLKNDPVEVNTIGRIGAGGELLTPEQRLRLSTLNEEIACHNRRVEVLTKNPDPDLKLEEPKSPGFPNAPATYSKLKSLVDKRNEEIRKISESIPDFVQSLNDSTIVSFLTPFILAVLASIFVSPGFLIGTFCVSLIASICGLFFYRRLYIRRQKTSLELLRSSLASEKAKMDEKVNDYNSALQLYKTELQKYRKMIAEIKNRKQAETVDIRAGFERLNTSRLNFISEIREYCVTGLHNSVTYEWIWSRILSEADTYLLEYPTACRLGSVPAFEPRFISELSLDRIRRELLADYEPRIHAFCAGLVLVANY
jgi:hypothetical protein